LCTKFAASFVMTTPTFAGVATMSGFGRSPSGRTATAEQPPSISVSDAKEMQSCERRRAFTG